MSSPILTLAGKDLRLLCRDKFGMFWIFAFPLMYAGFFGAIFSSSDDGARGKIPVAIVDDDGTEDSAILIETLAGHDAVRIDRDGEGDDAPWKVHSLEDAAAEVRRGRKTAYVRIPSGYGENPFAMFGGGDDDAAPIEVGIDPSRSAEGGMLQGGRRRGTVHRDARALPRQGEDPRRSRQGARRDRGGGRPLDHPEGDPRHVPHRGRQLHRQRRPRGVGGGDRRRRRRRPGDAHDGRREPRQEQPATLRVRDHHAAGDGLGPDGCRARLRDHPGPGADPGNPAPTEDGAPPETPSSSPANRSPASPCAC